MGGEHSLKILAPQLLQFVIYDILKIWSKRLTQRINYEGVCRTALATPGLLISELGSYINSHSVIYAKVFSFVMRKNPFWFKTYF